MTQFDTNDHFGLMQIAKGHGEEIATALPFG
jgi:hypothetical protein